MNGTYAVDEEMVRDYIKDMYERTHFLYTKEDGQVKAFEDPHNHVRAQMHSTLRQKNLANIMAETLIIHGTHDPIVLPTHAQVTAKHIKSSQLYLIEGMGHMIFNRNLEKKVARMITHFMNAAK